MSPNLFLRASAVVGAGEPAAAADLHGGGGGPGERGGGDGGLPAGEEREGHHHGVRGPGAQVLHAEPGGRRGSSTQHPHPRLKDTPPPPEVHAPSAHQHTHHPFRKLIYCI